MPPARINCLFEIPPESCGSVRMLACFSSKRRVQAPREAADPCSKRFSASPAMTFVVLDRTSKHVVRVSRSQVLDHSGGRLCCVSSDRRTESGPKA